VITLTRAEAVKEIDRIISRSQQPAVEIVAFLAVLGVGFQPDAKAPCRHCGNPWWTRSCPIGGCPLGADL